MLTKEKI